MSLKASHTMSHELIKSFNSIIQRYLVSIQFSTYSECIWYDILHIDIAHILLSRPLSFNLDVKSFGKSNTYTFIFHEKRIVLGPFPFKNPSRNENNGLVTNKQGYKSIHFMHVSHEHVHFTYKLLLYFYMRHS